MELLKYIRQLYSLQKMSSDDFILQHGRHFTPQSLPQHLEHHRGQKKQCYRNAFNLACSNNELFYVEGYSYNLFPAPHAWCTDKDGKVYEITWDEPGQEYFGVCFNTKYILEVILSKQYYGILTTRELLNGKHTHWKGKL